MRRDFLRLVLLSGLVPFESLLAQPPTPPLEGTREPKSKLRTTVSVELLTSPTTALEAQRWGAVFQKLGCEVRTRSAQQAKPEVREIKQGSQRTVTVIAILESNGTLLVPGRRFSADRDQAIADWLLELRTYGAQGRPDGKPSYGLSPVQFDELFRLLEAPVAKSTLKLPFDEALAAVTVNRNLSMRLSAEASASVQKLPRDWRLDAELKDLSRGTAIAIFLAAAGLAYRPGRTPDEELELVIVPINESGVWPVGWPLDKAPLKATPKLVALLPIEIEEAPLPAVFARASKECDIPVFVDQWRIAARGVDLAATTFYALPKRTMWSIILQNATSPSHLIREVLLDEAGKPFVWITTDDPKRANERAKQREVLMERPSKK